MDGADTIIVGGGLAGLKAAAELGDRGKRVILPDQEPGGFLGGQAFRSLGGLFMVDPPEQRRMGIRDSRDLAMRDWLGSAQFDRDEDDWPRQWAEAYVDYAAGEMRQWLRAPSVIVTSGGIGGNFEMVRKAWPRQRLGEPPRNMISGVPFHVDGRMVAISEQAGGHVINGDRMWHYTEGVRNWDPIWPSHGIRILPGPSSMWFDATGNRLKPPCLPGFDTLATLREILSV